MDEDGEDDDDQRCVTKNRRHDRIDGTHVENETLMNGDDSDFDRSVNRLCQFLHNSEDDDDEDGDECNLPLSVTPLPKTGVILNKAAAARYRPSRNSVNSNSLSDDDRNNCNCTSTASSSNSNNNMETSLGKSSHFRRPLPDFLNIPPPSHPPDESPIIEHRPIPPNWTLPPVPVKEEHQYEEARPPRPLKHQPRRENKYEQGPPMSMNNNIMNEDKPSYVSQGSQYNDVDWSSYKTSVLEQNETGSFYIPSSGQTTMSTISPSRKSETEQQNRHNYSLLPSAQTTVPVLVSPSARPPFAMGCSGGGAIPRKRKKSKCYCCCSWKLFTYILAVGLIFALAVICYLLVTVFSSDANSLKRRLLSEGPEPDSDSDALNSVARPLPESFEIGDYIVADLPPGLFRRTWFVVQRNSFVQFNLSVEPQAKLAIFGRQTLPPSPTEHDFSQIVLGAKLHASPIKRSLNKPPGYQYPEKNLRSTTFVRYLLEGKWHLALLNDDSSVSVVRYSTYLTDEKPKDCKFNCYEKGVCENGRCFCYHGYSGDHCEETICPVLCSGNGIFTNGKCHCHQGWKGADCNVPTNVCEVPNCNRNGHCNTDGECVCLEGYKGKFCTERDCAKGNCSNHGICVDGKCYCDFGWKGDVCDIRYASGELCQVSKSNDCSNRGTLDPSGRTCSCEFGFTGDKCEKDACDLDCGERGRCENHQCVCERGWTGTKCESLSCLPGCEEHGYCKNGSCVCNLGWDGFSCLLESCPNNCSNHGLCQRVETSWRCICESYFTGAACNIPLELQCSDKVDNDGDFLTDCEDSECCSNPSCQDSTMCQTVPDPHQVLIRTQAPPPQSSFFQKIRFLLDTDSLQRYSDVNLFNESRASVVRGRTVTARGSPVIGVRVVDTANALYGFTLSRSGGWFDLMVNGGGSITVHFMRLPFGSVFKTIPVGWNEIVYVGDVRMMSKEQTSKEDETTEQFSKHSFTNECADVEKIHNIKPYIVPSWTFTSLGSAPGYSGMVADAEAAQESLKIFGTRIYLTYFSATSAGHESTLNMQLVPTSYPIRLRLVTVVVDVEGNRFEQTFEARENLTFTSGWDMRNVYKQKVFGLSLATVSVGYHYSGCPNPIWEKQKVKLSGHRSSISDLGGWNLNIHHKYDILNGVVEKGDGSALYLKEQPPLLVTILDEEKVKQKMFQNGRGSTRFVPIAVAVAKDGKLYVGDQNSVKLLHPSGSLTEVLRLNPADTAHQYYMTVHPISLDLYVSLPLRRQVWRVRGNVSQISLDSSEIVVGTGEACLFDEDCGDGGPGQSAKLDYPKGIAFDSKGNLYLADERKIRRVSVNGVMSTLIGDVKNNVVGWRPLPCRTEFFVEEMKLQWPTMVINDWLNDKIMFVDGGTVFELDFNGKVRIVVGTSADCPTLTTPSNETLRPFPLKNVASIASNLDGKLLIAETDGRRLHRIRSFDRIRRRMTLLAGADSNCDCSKNCPCDNNSDVVPAKNARLNLPVSLAVDYWGIVYVADRGNFKVRTLKPSEPDFDPYYRNYQVFAPEYREVYLFNRHGQHVATKDLITDRFLYNFTYHVDSSYGTLMQIAAANGSRKLLINRKDRYKIELETSDGLKSSLHISRFSHMLEKYVDSDGSSWKFRYDNNKDGLIVSKKDSKGDLWLYRYDSNGHMNSLIIPTGEIYSLNNLIANDRTEINVYKNDKFFVGYKINDEEIDVTTKNGGKSVFLQDDGVFHLNTDDGSSVQYDSGTHALFDLSQSSVLRRELSIPSAPELARNELTSTLEWRFHLRRASRKRVAQVGRKTRINGVNLLNIEYDRDQNKDVLYNQNNLKLLEVQYNNFGEIQQCKPSDPFVAPTNRSFDSSGRLLNVQWGALSETYVYDTLGRILEMKSFNCQAPKNRKFSYLGDNTKPVTVELPSGDKYHISYDQQGRLSQITTPTSQQHKFNRFVGLGVVNFVYSRSNLDDDSFYLSRNFDGSLASLRYSSGEKLVTFDRDDAKRSTIYYDDVIVVFNYETIDALPSEITITVGNLLSVRKRYSYQGHLPVHVDEQRIYNANLSTDVNFGYHYDDNLRLTAVRSNFDDISRQPLQIDYDGSTGRKLKAFNFQYEYNNDGKIRLFDEKISIETFLSPNHLIALTKFIVHSRTICEQRIHYDSQARITSVSHLVGIDDYVASFEYDEVGRLTSAKVKRNQEQGWNYQYDEDGNIRRMNNFSVTYESKGQMTNFGQVEYKFNRDGFMVKRGTTTFEYDSFGRLIRAIQRSPTSIDNRYFYDDRHRLIVLKQSGKWYHFWYALVDKPFLITHAWDSDSRSLTLFSYDQFDRLFGYETGGTFTLVVCNPDRTPQFLFANDGSFVSWLQRAPFGETIPSSSADLHLPIGFKGQFQDFDLDVVIFLDTGRPYDAVSGRWMSIQIENVFQSIDLRRPESLSGYIFNNNDPMNIAVAIPRTFYEWTRLLGYDFDGFIPMLTPSKGPSFSCQEDSVLTLASECSLKKRVDKFHTFESQQISRLSPTFSISSPDITLSCSYTVFGEDVVASNVSNQLRLNFFDSQDENALLMLLNDSYILPFQFILDGKCMEFFWKSDSRDLMALGLSTESASLANFNLTISDTPNGHKDVQLWNKLSSINLHYGGDKMTEISRILRFVLSRLETLMWTREYTSVEGRSTSANWTEVETAELLSKGKLDDYEIRYVRNPLIYTKLVADPNNLRFSKRTP